MTDPVGIARRVAEIASDRLASDITVLDISDLSTIADVFVVCTADNVRQLNSLREELTSQLRDENVSPRRIEGVAEAGWILMDYGDVIIHLFTTDQREFYRLDDLWAEAPTLLKIQ